MQTTKTGHTYHYTPYKIGDRNTPIPVEYAGKLIGQIMPVKGGWQFFTAPKDPTSPIFKTIYEVQKHIEEKIQS